MQPVSIPKPLGAALLLAGMGRMSEAAWEREIPIPIPQSGKGRGPLSRLPLPPGCEPDEDGKMTEDCAGPNMTAAELHDCFDESDKCWHPCNKGKGKGKEEKDQSKWPSDCKVHGKGELSDECEVKVKASHPEYFYENGTFVTHICKGKGKGKGKGVGDMPLNCSFAGDNDTLMEECEDLMNSAKESEPECFDESGNYLFACKGNGKGEGKGQGNGQGKGQGNDQGKGQGKGEGKGQGNGQGKDQGKGQGKGQGEGKGQEGGTLVARRLLLV